MVPGPDRERASSPVTCTHLALGTAAQISISMHADVDANGAAAKLKLEIQGTTAAELSEPEGMYVQLKVQSSHESPKDETARRQWNDREEGDKKQSTEPETGRRHCLTEAHPGLGQAMDAIQRNDAER